MSKTLKMFIDDSLMNISSFGSYQFFILLTIYFLITNNIPAGLFLVTGFIIIQVLVLPTRLVFFKERPKKKKFTNTIEKIKASSMPSMHAALIGFLLQSMLFYINGAFLGSIFFVIITILVLYSRTHLKEHKPIDVVVGFLLGTFVFVAMLLSQVYLL